MKRNKVLIVILLLILCTLIYYVGCSYILRCLSNDKLGDGEQQKPYVAVVVKSTTSNFWKELTSGITAAAAEYNIQVTIEGPDNEEDYVTQNNMLQEAIDQGAQLIIFSAIDYNGNAEMVEQAINQGIQVISIDSDVNSDLVSYKIGTDNYVAGCMTASAVLDFQEEELYIGIVNFDKNSANGQEREKGLRDTVEGDERIKAIETINVNSTTQDAKNGTIQLLKENTNINVIVALNEWTALGAGVAIQELGLEDQVHVVAFDNNPISVYMLEEGEVDALIVQNPFAMGYLGIEMAYQILNEQPLESKDIDTKTTLVTKENMFDEEFQRILFPFD